MVLCSLHRLTPLVQRFYVSNTQKEFLSVVLILGMFAIALSYASRSTDLSAPPILLDFAR